MNIDQITADTTDEQILAGVRAAKQRLAHAAAAETADSESLAGLVNSVAAAEGRAFTQASIRDRIAQGIAPSDMIRSLTSQVLLPVIGQDTWSGRKNDTRRAYLDGVKEVINEAVWKFR